MTPISVSEANLDTSLYVDRQSGPTRIFQTLLRSVNGLIARTGGIKGSALPLPAYTVLTVPDAATYAQCLIYVSNESGGAVPAFSDGTNWRRVTDRTVIS